MATQVMEPRDRTATQWSLAGTTQRQWHQAPGLYTGIWGRMLRVQILALPLTTHVRTECLLLSCQIVAMPWAGDVELQGTTAPSTRPHKRSLQLWVAQCGVAVNRQPCWVNSG